MKTVIAYILVIVLGQFAFTIGTMVGSGLFGILLYYLPLRIKIPLGLFLAGVLGSFTVIMYGYLIFWLFGLPFTFYPLLASILSMTLPLYNDYKMHSHRSQGIKEIDNHHRRRSQSPSNRFIRFHNRLVRWYSIRAHLLSSLKLPALRFYVPVLARVGYNMKRSSSLFIWKLTHDSSMKTKPLKLTMTFRRFPKSLRT